MFFRASIEAKRPIRLYSNVPQQKYVRQEDASAVVRSLMIEDREVIVSEGGRGSLGQDYYIDIQMNDEQTARSFLDRNRATISAMMQAGEGMLIPYERDTMKDTITNINKSIDVLNKELASIRVGRANPNLLANVKVDYYGVKTAIAQMGNVSAPEARTLTVKPWDASQLKAIEKAIRESNLDLNPQLDGDLLRIAIPVPTEERRKEYAKSVRQYGEKCKVALRAIRHDALKAASGSQDEIQKTKKVIEEHITAAIKRVEDAVAAKEKEVLTV
jgi:ribosome recycling factor